VVVSDGLPALDFYKCVFGGTDGDNMMAQTGSGSCMARSSSTDKAAAEFFAKN
jgi:hypothetical protein